MNKTYMPKSRVVKVINSHLLTLLPFEDEHEANLLPAVSLLTPERFDVLAKYIYARLRGLNAAQEWRNRVFFEPQKIFGFVEQDGSGKRSLEDYLSVFNDLIDGLQANGFQDDSSMVPVGNGNVIIDGAHRLGASLHLNLQVPVIHFNMTPAVYDSRYFLERGLSPDVADAMTHEYCRLAPNMVIAVLFPVAEGRDVDVESILTGYGRIVYKKEISFTEIGRHNLIRQLYRHEPWLGSPGEITPGLKHHVENRFKKNRPVKFYFLLADDPARLREAKESIRGLFGIKNDSIHINDTHEETLRIAGQILNPNSVHFLNHAQPWLFPGFLSMFEEYKKEIDRQSLDKELFCVDSGAVLAAYGLREAGDLDYLHTGRRLITNGDSAISAHEAESRSYYYDIPVADILYDPANHFYFDGMKFVSLPLLRAMKKRRNESKDIRDLLLIDSLGDEVGSINKIWRTMRFTLKKAYESIRHFEIWKIKNLLPSFLHPFARAVFHAPFHMSQMVGPLERTIQYRGFVLHYSRGTSLIYRIHNGKVYEPELTWAILETLKRKDEPVFMDIGANIGLITLNVLSAIPHARVFAFEPGPHQSSLLEKTISSNNLAEKVELYKEALGREPGQAVFNIHNTRDVSGDGFFDTGRSGDTLKITVPVNTLDAWWQAAGMPRVDVVKMDAEGAEGWILEGASKFLQESRPCIFLEISIDNLRMYPYNMEFILNLLHNLGYNLQTLGGKIVYNAEELYRQAESTQDFFAYSN